MDINLPLILFLAVAISGLIWLFDIVFLRNKRLLAIAAIESEFADLSAEEKERNDKYSTSLARVKSEPVPVEYAKSFFPVLFIVFFLRSFLLEPFQIPSESMVPTLEVGDFILVNKFVYDVRLPVVRKKVIEISDPKRGDVMVFFPPKEKRYFIKRVIGLPGDTIRMDNNVLYINGEEMVQSEFDTEPDYVRDGCGARSGRYVVATETFADGHQHKIRKCNIKSGSGQNGYWIVPEGHYFMMGDNRDNSSDSRYWGFVPEENIVGKAFAIWMHWESMMSIPSFSRVGSI